MRIRRLGCVVMALAGIVASCTSSSSSSSAFAVKDTLATRNMAAGDQLIIYLVSQPGICSLFTTGNTAPFRDYDIITIEFNTPMGSIGPGMKTVAAGDGGYSATQGTAFYVGNRACNTRYGGGANGTVNITALDATHVTGTYDFSFANGWPYDPKTTSGSFDAPICDPGPTKLAAIACQ
jgi:hypothetical protein